MIFSFTKGGIPSYLVQPPSVPDPLCSAAINSNWNYPYE